MSTVQFNAASYSVDAAQGAITVTVTRSTGTGLSAGTTLSYHTIDGTALSGQDYSQTEGVLTWVGGEETDKSFAIRILPSAQAQSDKTFYIQLGIGPIATRGKLQNRGNANAKLRLGGALTVLPPSQTITTDSIQLQFPLPAGVVFTPDQLPAQLGTPDKAAVTIRTSGRGWGLKAEYFDNIDLTNLRLTETNAVIDFTWGTTPKPEIIRPGTFSVRWTGQVLPAFSEEHTFSTVAEDGVRLWVNGRLVINDWTEHDGPVEKRGVISLVAGQKVDLKLEYYNNLGAASVKFFWSSSRQKTRKIVPQDHLFPTSAAYPR
ncbi:MAG: hypothetical protein HYY23_20315 [Verrucomicrobia bacterium]|nr:hypothetical protein [Verrucomicrobiota bacterium]